MKTKISQSELDVMDVLWADSPLGAVEVAARLETLKNWNIRTVKTLLARLVKKQALATTKQGQRYLYTPLVSKEAYAQSATRSLIDRLFGGRAAPLIAHLAADKALSPQDIKDIETLLAKMKAE
ncbi:MAG: CopY family transcriptional repressor [Robiginitomaculum sp.]|nr:MAG: CopY family transcriptional repressor [Robiginitomaculum sp.]